MTPVTVRRIAFGSCALFWLAVAASCAHADSIALTRADLARISEINLSVNAALPIRRPDGIGNCVQVSERKYQALSAFIPAHALHTVIVRTPMGRHQLTMIETTQGPLYLDMNSPWLETAAQARAMGYQEIDQREEWRRAFRRYPIFHAGVPDPSQ